MKKKKRNNPGTRNGMIIEIKETVSEIRTTVEVMRVNQDVMKKDIVECGSQYGKLTDEMKRMNLLILGNPESTDSLLRLGFKGRIEKCEHWIKSFRKKLAFFWSATIAFLLAAVKAIFDFLTYLLRG